MGGERRAIIFRGREGIGKEVHTADKPGEKGG